MKIVRVRATALSANFADIFGGIDKIPSWILRPTAHFQAIPRSGQYSTLVVVEAEDGSVGYGEAWGLPLPEVSAIIVNKLLAPLIVGRDLDELGAVWREITLYFKRLGFSRGGTMEALSGVDIALWDLRARLAGKPVNALVGPRLRDVVDCYASPIMFKDTVLETRDAALQFRQAGFEAIKIKAGRGIEVDIAHIGAVREAVGADVRLMVDVNGGFDLRTAIGFAKALEPFDICWLEEPLPSGQLLDYARLKQETAVALACGENDFATEDFAALIEIGGIDVVMPNVTRAGGITGVLEIARLADAAGARFSMHGVGSVLMQCASLHVLSVVPNAHYFEVNTFPNPLRDSLALPSPSQRGGRMTVPVSAGLGCEIDQDSVERFRAA